MNPEQLLQEALAHTDGALSALAVCAAGNVTAYAATGDSRHFAPKGAGPLLELVAEAARRAERGVFSYRDPDGRTPGVVLSEPVEGTRVLVGVSLGERSVASLRLRQLALHLRLLG